MSTGTLRTTYWSVTKNGTAWTPNLIGITVTAGFDQQVMEATIKAVTDNGHPALGDWIEIIMGATSGTATKRFAGYFMEADYTLWPREVSFLCKSVLVRAQNYANPAQNGTDLSAAGVGQTDQDMVTQILTACGLTTGGHVTLGTIGGLGRTLGKRATAYYIWSEGDDGLSAIQLIDELCQGYRTFDVLDAGVAKIVRRQVSIIPSGSPSATFNQGDDILAATNQISIVSSRNKFLVTGYNPSTAQANTVGFTKNGVSGSPLPFVAEWSYSSSMIEYDTEAHRPSGEGVSCEEIADWANGQYNLPIIKVPFTTQRDDEILPGDLIAVIADHAAIGTIWGLALYWVQSVANEIDEAGSYSQKLVCIQGGS